MSVGWLKQEHFENMLKNNVKNYSKIKSFTIKPGSGAGEHYLSEMFKVLAEIELHDSSLRCCNYILKVAPGIENGSHQYIKNGNFFRKENLMYDEIIPAFEKLYLEKGYRVIFGPQSYHFDSDVGIQNVITEDLGLKGYSNPSRIEGLDAHQCFAVIEKLAKFHAASAVYYNKNGPYEEVFNINLFVESSLDIFMEFNKNIMESMEPCIKHFCTNGNYFTKKFIKKDIKEYVRQLMESEMINYEEFNVLNHGDFWANNILFQYNNKGEITDTKFIDFQTCKYGSPALDLWYFIMSSAKLDLKVNRFDDFIRVYHKHLVDSLKFLDYAKPFPTLQALHDSLLRHPLWATLPLCGVMAAALLNPNEQANMENFINESGQENTFKNSMYSNPRYIESMNVLLPWLDAKGILDKKD